MTKRNTAVDKLTVTPTCQLQKVRRYSTVSVRGRRAQGCGTELPVYSYYVSIESSFIVAYVKVGGAGRTP